MKHRKVQQKSLSGDKESPERLRAGTCETHLIGFSRSG
jgi:hypothetical protein